MPINDRTINWNLHVVGAPEAANDMNMVANSMSGLDDTSRIAATRFTGLASASSAMGTVLSQTSPKVAGLASIMGTAGGAVSGLITLLGGVGGLAAGGLIVVLGLLIKHFADSTSAIDEFTEGMDKATGSLDEYKKKLEEIEAKEMLLNRIREGSITILEGRALVMQREAEISELAARMAAIREDAGLFGLSASEEGQILVIERMLKKKKGEIQVFTQNLKDQIEFDRKNLEAIWGAKSESDRAKERAAKKGGKGKKALEPWEEEAIKDKAIHSAQLMEDEVAKWASRAAQMKGGEGRDFNPMAEALGLGPDKWKEEIEYADAALAEIAEKEKQMATISKGAFDVVATAGANAFMELAKGGEVSAAAIIEGIGDQLYAKGIAHLLEALAMVWIPGLQGNAGGLAAAGGVEMAAGLAMGAAGAAAGGGSTGGGGGGGGGGFRDSPFMARPTPVEPGRERFQNQPTELHFHHLKPSKDVGKEVATSLQMYGQKFGRSAMPKIPGIN